MYMLLAVVVEAHKRMPLYLWVIVAAVLEDAP
jgi:hypothetical protein